MIVDAPRISPVSGNASSPQADASARAPLAAASAAIEIAASAHNTEDLRLAIAAAVRANKSLSNNVELSLDAQSGKPIVRVIDSETGQLIRQIPSEEILELRRALDRIAAGLLIHRTA